MEILLFSFGNNLIPWSTWLGTNVHYHVFLPDPKTLEVWQGSEWTSKAHSVLLEREPPVFVSLSF